MKESKDVWTLESGLEPGANSALCTCVYGAGRKGDCARSRIVWIFLNPRIRIEGKMTPAEPFQKGRRVTTLPPRRPPPPGTSVRQTGTHGLSFSESLGTKSSHRLFKCSNFQKSQFKKSVKNGLDLGTWKRKSDF